MKAAHFADGRIEMIELPTPRPVAGQALLRTRLSGVCNTDLELLAGYYAFDGVPGHEFTATVIEAPDAPQWLGKRVVADINIGCGICWFCRRGNHRHCRERRVIGIKHVPGCFAEYLLAPVANLLEVPPELPDESAVFCEPLAAALEVSQQAHITGGMRVAVLGDGKLGLLAALALRQYNPGVVLIGRHAEKLAVAAAQGVATLYAPAQRPWPETVAKLGPMDLVVEATGRPEGVEAAMDLLRPEGVLVAKTTSHLPSTINMARVVVDEITIMGSRCGDMALAMDMLARGRVDVRPLIQGIFKGDEFPAAMARAAEPGAGKVLVRWS